MRHPFYRGVVLGSVVSIVALMASTALAGTGIGAVFNLGKSNSVNRSSTLTGSTSGKMLQVTNKGSGPALGLTVQAGKAPMTVNSATRVTNLNADMIDGLHASDLGQTGSIHLHRTVPLTTEPFEILTVPGFGILKGLAAANSFERPTFYNTENTGDIRVTFGGQWSVVPPGASCTHEVKWMGTTAHLSFFVADSARIGRIDVRLWIDATSVEVFAEGSVK